MSIPAGTASSSVITTLLTTINIVVVVPCRYSEFTGFHGILAGLLVAVKQIMPDHEVILGGLVKLKAKVWTGRSCSSVYLQLQISGTCGQQSMSHRQQQHNLQSIGFYRSAVALYVSTFASEAITASS